jgi:hypothetical protein
MGNFLFTISFSFLAHLIPDSMGTRSFFFRNTTEYEVDNPTPSSALTAQCLGTGQRYPCTVELQWSNMIRHVEKLTAIMLTTAVLQNYVTMLRDY